MMTKKIIFLSVFLFNFCFLFSQYNYGLEVENHDAKIEGKLNLGTPTYENIYIGRDAGGPAQYSHNIAIGNGASLAQNIGNLSIAIGQMAHRSANFSSRNVTVGSYAARHSLTLADNVYLGDSAGNRGISFSTSTVQTENIFIGSSSGFTGDATRNLIIGYQAGHLIKNQDSDNLLIIENNNALGDDTNHLIFGEFDNRKLGINWASDDGTGLYPTIPSTLSINGTLHISETAKLQPGMQPSTCTTIDEVGIIYYDRNLDGVYVCTNANGWQPMN